jgi:hypothetical protein
VEWWEAAVNMVRKKGKKKKEKKSSRKLYFLEQI